MGCDKKKKNKKEKKNKYLYIDSINKINKNKNIFHFHSQTKLLTRIERNLSRGTINRITNIS